jgi:DNA polymerase-3 subunit gamma/tau
MRDGLSLLDQAIAFGGGSLKDTEVASMLGSIDHVHIAAIIDALSGSDAGALMSIVNDLVSQSRNLESVLDELAEAMHRIALIHAAPGFRDPERGDWDALVERAQLIAPEDAQLYYQIAINGRRDLGLAPDPRTGLEMTLLRMLAFRPAEPGTGAAPAPAATSGGGNVQEPRTEESRGGAQATGSSVPGASSEAAQTARAAFDEMHRTGRDSSSVTPATALKLDPDTAPAVGEDELAPEQGTDEAGQDWASLQASLDLSGVTREFARNLQLEKKGEKRWKFLVPDALEQLGSESVIRSLQSALSTHLGHEVTLDLHTETRPLESVAAVTERAELNRMSEAERAIDEDATIKEIKEKFGATIVPDSIQPLQ